jgi:Domain of unknown function (DUF4387)
MIASNTDHRGQAVRLDSIAKVIRSKNAGPCLLTLDLMLPDEAAFAYVAARVGAFRTTCARYSPADSHPRFRIGHSTLSLQ